MSKKFVLGICVINCEYGGNKEETLASVSDLPVHTHFYFMDSFSDVQQHLVTSKEDWTLILYAREALDVRFNDAIEVMLAEESVSAYKFFCTVKTASTPIVVESVRLFKRGVILKKDALRPAQPELSVVRILDGWIYEHGTDKDIDKIFRAIKYTEQLGKADD